MAWYKTGSVSVTSGQTTVTGIGTNFASNVRVGDGFKGPNGLWYEVVNVASQTVLGILPAYAGPTVTANTNYMIAPIQGYNKESADRLRAITDTLPNSLDTKQDKNANLTSFSSLVGAANRIPMFTGAGALSLAVLTAAQTANTLTFTASDILRAGEAGYASRKEFGFYTNETTLNIDNLPGGWCGLVSTSVGGAMPPLTGGFFWIETQQTYSGMSAMQTAVQYGGGATDPANANLQPNIAVRIRNQPGSAWGPWGKIQTSRDIVSSISDQTAGKLLTVGYQGLGSNVSPSLVDMDAPFGSGFSWATSATSNLWPGYSSGSNFITTSASTSEAAQIGFSRTTPMRVAVRRKTSGVWQPQQEVVFGTKIASNVDTNSDRILTTGFQGLGGAGPIMTNWNEDFKRGSGFFQASSTATGGPGTAGYNVTGVNMMLNTGPIGGQLGIYNGDSRLVFRSAYNGYLPWMEVVHTGNATFDPALNTGGLMFYGTNANGEFWKFANGMLVCRIKRTVDVAVTSAATGVYFGNSPVWTYPSNFVGIEPFVSAVTISPGVITWDASNLPTFTSVQPPVVSVQSIANRSYTQHILAVGKWK